MTPALQAAARHGRREAERHASAPLLRAVKLFEKESSPCAPAAWAWAGLAVTIWRLMREAQSHAGRELIGVVNTLHQKLGLRAIGENLSPETAAALDKFEPWLAETAADTRARAALINLIDIFSERLTLHRYTDAAHRRRHAIGLIATPLGIVTGSSAPSFADFAEGLLRYWDLTHAPEHIEYGWNRLLPEGASALGGFYGLADQAKIPQPEQILAAVEALARDLEAADARKGLPVPWTESTRHEMLAYLHAWQRTGTRPQPERSRFGLLGRLLRRPRRS